MGKQQLLLAAVVIIITTSAAASLLREKTAAMEGEAVVHLQASSGKTFLIKAEIADTEEEIKKGLMFRERLGESEGMFFVFPEEAVQRFWMKDTLIPLDIVFIAKNGTIVRIHHALPCREEPCESYSSEKPAMHVLEVNGNLTSKWGVKEGSAAGIIR